MTCIKCCRKVAKVFAIFVIDYTHEIIKETEKITLKTLRYTFYSLYGAPSVAKLLFNILCHITTYACVEKT